MKLYEYEAKQVYEKYHIPIPQAILITSAGAAREKAAKLKPPYAVKAQVLSGGRGKAGGILFAETAKQAEEAAAKLLEAKINNLPVRKVFIEEKLPVAKEFYLGITVDRFNRTYAVLASAAGGVEIEELAATNPKAVIKLLVNPQLGIRPFHATAVAKKLGYSGNQLAELARIIQNLYQVLVDNDAELVEINPLAQLADGSLMALDARLTIDDSALFRHQEYKNKMWEQELTPQEVTALKNGLAYVELDGNIGVIGNGAGLVMATLDLINIFGGTPADFLDLGGAATTENIIAAVRLVSSTEKAKVLFINILGGLIHCDIVAKAIVETAVKKPLVVRLVGTNEKEGKEILSDAGIAVFDSMEEAAVRAVKLASGG